MRTDYDDDNSWTDYMRDFSRFLFFHMLGWLVIIALRCYWSTILKQGGIGF